MKMIPTQEVIDQYKKDVASILRMKDDMAQLNAINEIEQMAEYYDWTNQIFTDETTGKKGLRDVEGTILVPALYDDFPEVGSFRLFHKRPHVARKGDKYGIVAADGTGRIFTAFIYDSLKWDYFSPLYCASWGGAQDRYGLIFEDGQVLLPCCITQLYQPQNNIYSYQSGELQGIINLATLRATAPLFSEIEIDPETGIVTVTKDGEKGVLTANSLQFVPLAEGDNDNGEYLCEELDF